MFLRIQQTDFILILCTLCEISNFSMQLLEIVKSLIARWKSTEYRDLNKTILMAQSNITLDHIIHANTEYQENNEEKYIYSRN